MLDKSLVIKLKRNNISANAEKTMQRVRDLWKAASKADKLAVEELAGVERVTIARVYKTGSISAKLAVALGQTLNADPFYLTGESDERGECTDEILRKFLAGKGYKSILKGAGKGTGRKAAQEPKALKQKAAAPKAGRKSRAAPAPHEKAAPKKALAASAKMPEEEMLQIIRSLYVRAKYSSQAADLLGQIQDLVL